MFSFLRKFSPSPLTSQSWVDTNFQSISNPNTRAENGKVNDAIYIGLGSNLSNHNYSSPRDAINTALQAIKNAGIKIILQSRLYETVPIPVSNQQNFNNMVIKIHSELSPLKLLGLLHGIEATMGRIRHLRNEARIIDLDLLAFGSRHSNLQECVLPHPRMIERAFVLYPLAEIAPEWRHPVNHKTVSTLIKELPPGQIFSPINE